MHLVIQMYLHDLYVRQLHQAVWVIILASLPSLPHENQMVLPCSSGQRALRLPLSATGKSRPRYILRIPLVR